MNKQLTPSLFSLSLIALLCLPGCQVTEWFKDRFGGEAKPVTQSESRGNSAKAVGTTKEQSGFFVAEDGSKVLASMQGRPLMTEKSLMKEIEALKSNPEFSMALKMGGEEMIKRGLLQRKVTSSLYQKYLQDQGVIDSREYRDELARVIEAITDQFNQMYFLKAIPVAEKDKRAWYEKNKEVIPNLKISEGGVKVAGILTENEDKAKNVIAKAKEVQGDLKKAAQQLKIAADQVTDFNLVHAGSIGVDDAIKKAVADLKSFPATVMVKTDKGVWVIAATTKEEPKYAPYEQVAEEIGRLLSREAAEGKIEELSKSYKVVIADEYTKPLELPGEGISAASQMRMTEEEPAQQPVKAARPA